MKSLQFYLHFAGTITQTDVVDMILERFADKSWQLVEKEWQEGRIGSRECLTQQMEFVKASPGDLKKISDEVKVDPFFLSFLQLMRRSGVQVAIVSDGFGFIIRHILEKYLGAYPEILKSIPVYCNNIEWTAAAPKVIFGSEEVCVHACANCKPAVIRKTAGMDDMVLFVGDGLSDRYAAQVSHRTFAKGKLLKFCRDHALVHEAYANFKDIENWFLKNNTLSSPKALVGDQP